MKLGGKIGCFVAVIVAVLAIIALFTTVTTRQMSHTTSIPGAVAVRAYLFVDEPAPPGYGAYGYLLFNAQPSSNELKRYQQVCESYKRSLIASPGLSEMRAREMATFWPLQMKRATRVGYSCYTMIERYDYRRAAEISSAVHKQGARGPVLTAWTKPFEENSSTDALVLDLSDFSQEDLDRAFAIWRERITTNPEAWQNGLNLIVFREAFRSLLQTHGETILAIVHPSK